MGNAHAAMFAAVEAGNVDRLEEVISRRQFHSINERNPPYAQSAHERKERPLASTPWPCHVEIARSLYGVRHRWQVSDERMTALHHAAWKGNAQVVKLLIAHGANVRATSRTNLTPLHLAAFRGHKVAVQLLLNHDAAVDATDASGRTPLLLSVSHTDVAENLLAHGAYPKHRNLYGRTALHGAAALTKPDATVLLLAAGASPNVLDYKGLAPLHDAASLDRVPTVRHLLAAGANVDLQADFPENVFVTEVSDATCSLELHDRMLELSRREGEQCAVVVERLQAGHAGGAEVARLSFVCAEAHFKFKTVQSQQQTALHSAAAVGAYATVVELLRAGASPLLTDASSLSAFQLTRDRRIRAVLQQAARTARAARHEAEAAAVAAVLTTPSEEEDAGVGEGDEAALPPAYTVSSQDDNAEDYGAAPPAYALEPPTQQAPATPSAPSKRLLAEQGAAATAPPSGSAIGGGTRSAAGADAGGGKAGEEEMTLGGIQAHGELVRQQVLEELSGLAARLAQLEDTVQAQQQTISRLQASDDGHRREAARLAHLLAAAGLDAEKGGGGAGLGAKRGAASPSANSTML